MNARTGEKENRDLYKILEITRAMVATEDLDALLNLIVERSMELLGAERSTIFLYDQVGQRLISRVAAGAEELRIPIDRGIAGATVTTDSTINVPDAYADERFNPDVDRQTGFRTRNLLSMPLHDYEGSLVGVLQVLNKRSGQFDQYDITLAESLGAQAGVALQRARLISHFLQKQQMERAMRIARDIQQKLLPQDNPRVCGFEVAGLADPADETGGDTYDFMPLADGRWILAVADATGHGIGPALVIAETRAMLRALSLGTPDVSTVLATVNSLLTADLGDGRFVTCFFSLLDPLVARLTFASAGHGPLLFYRRNDDAFQELTATTLPLGLMHETSFDEVSHFQFAPGDFAVITTDGFFEATSPADEQFGIQRMMDLLRRDRDLPAEKMIANLHRAVMDFAAGQPQADDLTAIILRKK